MEILRPDKTLVELFKKLQTADLNPVFEQSEPPKWDKTIAHEIFLNYVSSKFSTEEQNEIMDYEIPDVVQWYHETAYMIPKTKQAAYKKRLEDHFQVKINDSLLVDETTQQEVFKWIDDNITDQGLIATVGMTSPGVVKAFPDLNIYQAREAVRRYKEAKGIKVAEVKVVKEDTPAPPPEPQKPDPSQDIIHTGVTVNIKKDAQDKDRWQVKEGEDTYTVIARGISDETIAKRIATEKKGRVTKDDQDKEGKKFMVVTQESQIEESHTDYFSNDDGSIRMIVRSSGGRKAYGEVYLKDKEGKSSVVKFDNEDNKATYDYYIKYVHKVEPFSIEEKKISEQTPYPPTPQKEITCTKCGYAGEIPFVDGKAICPKCQFIFTESKVNEVNLQMLANEYQYKNKDDKSIATFDKFCVDKNLDPNQRLELTSLVMKPPTSESSNVNECPTSKAIADQEGAEEKEVEQIMQKIGIDFSKYNLQELLKGIKVEKEHTASVGGGLETLIKIAIDHLNELPDYYTRLDKMEKEAGKQETTGVDPATADLHDGDPSDPSMGSPTDSPHSDQHSAPQPESVDEGVYKQIDVEIQDLIKVGKSDQEVVDTIKKANPDALLTTDYVQKVRDRIKEANHV